ncbi:hypothetical protein XB86_08545 [Acinetobacter baumannii]|nr:hypothetical protein [Acinetobacter baumannii]MDR8185457.1 hypothetical protein [Acinetobacter baumannii]
MKFVVYREKIILKSSALFHSKYKFMNPEPTNLNQIKSNQIKSNQIKSNQIKSNQIKSNQIKSYRKFKSY